MPNFTLFYISKRSALSQVKCGNIGFLIMYVTALQNHESFKNNTFVLQKALNGMLVLLLSKQKTRAAMQMHNRCCGGTLEQFGLQAFSFVRKTQLLLLKSMKLSCHYLLIIFYCARNH